ncbi:MG2 domain-containing protein [Caloranaerobacter azorensis DSM 13643]|uniref:MG2 domain-containing protein n=1 Tax=Caloranaerobacter azorensis DSM 13643 TaxID=1121264 RepID=A0A1M5SL76_9FIRM|nr:S-layer homology domain-containing protein [Caloranaerobacter azorensis]SHH39170.1 MG2 domain-containing protein [Caloranaerobacter azorensis DSM 13643]
MKKFFSVILILTVLFVSAFSSIAASSQYEIEVNLSQDKLLPGSEVEIFGKVKENGNGYSNTPVTIVIEREEDKSKVFVKELMTDSNGDFRTVFKLNKDIAYGKYDIYISSVGIVKIVHFTVEKNKPTSELILELDKTKYYSGDTVKISGVAYKEGAIVSYTPIIIKIFYDDQIKFVKELMTDSEGKFSVEYKTMPEQATGVYKVQAEALGITVEKTFNIAKKPSTGGGGGGGGGSSSSGASKNKGKEVKETEQGKLTIEKDKNGNILATFEIDNRKLMKQLEKDNQNKLIINATSGKDADRVAINMDSEIVVEIGKKGRVIEIDIDQVKVEIEPEALRLEENSKISFEVRKLKKEEANQYLKELNVRYLPVSNIFDFKLVQIKGEKETKLIFKKPLIITINYNKDKVKNYKKLGVYYLNESTKTWEYVGGLPSQNGTITFKAGHFSKYTVMEYNKVFADVDIPWANEAVEVLTARHIIDGVDDKHYAPYANITRAQFAKLLVYALDLEKGENEVTFTDVKGNVWYKDSVETAASLGIVKGYNGCFNPNGEITREQMATMIVRAMKYLNPDADYSSQLSFMDKEEISNWAKEAVGIAYNKGIVNGVGENKFAPKDTANRAQAAVMIYRLLEVLNRM